MVVWLLLNQFWCHVQRCSFDGGKGQSLLCHRSCEPKVTELQLSIRSDENVLRLHIAVYDLVRMKVMQRSYHLLRNVLNLDLWERTICFQDFEKLPLCQLSHKTELVVRLECVQQHYDVRVIELALNLDFLSQVSEVFLTLPMFGNVFQRDNLRREFPSALKHFPETPLPDQHPNLIVLHLSEQTKISLADQAGSIRTVWRFIISNIPTRNLSRSYTTESAASAAEKTSHHHNG
mmetsp:Transcript_46889/g.146961  ORF Transcript_46889/g.146961 Transcript_46889/m.146961 type:complete len:234 (-) Transcript_46889:125-826(-)